MAVYKVAQDVEADDKLLGPFTARQFIYLIIVALAGLLAWFLSRVFLPLMIIPAPVILFFGALALPLRKDQPMEVYLAAMLSFYLKPRRRLWLPDGIESLVEIIAPKAAEDVQRTKDFSQAEAEERLSYLANIVDTGGWAVRNVTTGQEANTSMITDVYNAAQAAEDPLDDSGAVAQNFGTMIAESDEKRRQEVIERMHTMQAPPSATPALAPAPTQPVAQSTPINTTTAPAPQPAAPQAAPQMQDDASDVHFNPYPAIHQSVIQPLDGDDQASQIAQAPSGTASADDTAKTTSTTAVSPDIINLVNNSDLSIETIAREAHRIQGKDDGEEVIISLR